jgi:hypothetical protein
MCLLRHLKQIKVKRHWDTIQCELTASLKKHTQKKYNGRLRTDSENSECFIPLMLLYSVQKIEVNTII